MSDMPRLTSLLAGDCYKAEALPTKCMPAHEHCGEDSLRLLAIISHGSWTAAQKLELAYHLERERGQLRTPLLDAQMALDELYLCAH